MGIVIGPIKEEDWQVMRMLKTQIAYMQTKPLKFSKLLPESTELYKNKYLKGYVSKELP